ncbi:MAG: hypothetical protein DRH15_06020 [Deltaproteobacteria bacterium]|nr:DUF4911 domain-containing protein [Deltaproteobacteria bacterium]RLB82521.1 MAG: hypothetical protein DRH15_06020 [Deltaproteobacteria bacterium]HDM10619.1 DUF4911 domain-containing protein [Desulfobacteraceae bacterium]
MKCEKVRLKVNPAQICYIRNTLESYDGMALVRTIDPRSALLEVHVAPGCKDLVYCILGSLKKEGVSIFLTKEGNF